MHCNIIIIISVIYFYKIIHQILFWNIAHVLSLCC